MRASVVLPRWSNIANAQAGEHIPWGVVVANTLSMAVWSVGVFAALYAGYLRPEIRVTASQMSAVVNGVATILMFAFIDPYLSLLTDDVVAGRLDEALLPAFGRVADGQQTGRNRLGSGDTGAGGHLDRRLSG